MFLKSMGLYIIFKNEFKIIDANILLTTWDQWENPCLRFKPSSKYLRIRWAYFNEYDWRTSIAQGNVKKSRSLIIASRVPQKHVSLAYPYSQQGQEI